MNLIKPNVNIWYHGTEKGISGPLRSIYLTPSKNLAKLHGDVYAFRIDPNARWLDIGELSWGVPSMDTMGYAEGMDERFRSKGFDVVWDRSDYRRGHQQIYVVNPEVLSMVDNINESIKLNKLLMFLEAISPEQVEKIASAEPNDVITVYHGTPKFRLPLLLSGFDATQDIPRDYGGPVHRGLFVTPDFEVAKNFGGGAIIEIKVPAKFIHGTNYSGFIGRKQQKEKGKEIFDWIKEKFPNSFRPYMSHTMLSSGAEPQGLLIGVVKPTQITKVWIYEHESNQWVEYDRKEYLKKRDVYNRRRVLDRYEEETFFDPEIHMADPNLDLQDFVKALARFENREGMEEKYLKFLKMMGSVGRDRLEEKLSMMEIGGAKLGKLAMKNIIDQVMELVEKEKKPKIESTLSIDKLLHYLEG